MQLSIVIPVYNEIESLPVLISTLRRVMDSKQYSHEVIFIDDGSTDGTTDLLRKTANENPKMKVLFFSRNFGHQAAITAGLDFASGEAVAVMDADLQDPPELLPEMVALLEQGYDIVSAQRMSRSGEGRVKRYTARLFYWIIRKVVDKRIQPEVV